MLFAPLIVLLSLPQSSETPTCRAEVRWQSSPEHARRDPGPRTLSVFSAVSRPSPCGPAEIRLTVSYVDAGGELICSGSMDGLASQEAPTQVFSFELRPTNLFEFLRVTNLSRTAALRWRTLKCMSDAVTEIQPGALERAATVHLYATTLANYGGLATDRLELPLR